MEQEFEALRVALKAKEAADSRAAAISRGSFKTSTLLSANFTPLNSYDNIVGANYVYMHPAPKIITPVQILPHNLMEIVTFT